MNNFNDRYTKCIDELGKVMITFEWENKKKYAHWLAQTHYIVRHSTRLLTLASTLTPMSNEDLHRRYIDHAIEERGHEMMSVNDLKAINDTIDNYPELPSTSGFYQSQYYWIAYNNPDAFFGYIIMLEGLAAAHAYGAYKRVVEAHGPKAGLFLRVHSEEDQEHVKKATAHIKAFPEKIQQAVIQNMEASTFFYKSMLDEITRDIDQNLIPSAA